MIWPTYVSLYNIAQNFLWLYQQMFKTIRFYSIYIACIVTLSTSALLLGCSESSSPSNSESAASSSQTQSDGEQAKNKKGSKRDNEAKGETVSPRDWEMIIQSGELKVSKLKWEEESLPRSGTTSSFHFKLVESFAKEHNLSLKWHTVSSLREMFELLKSGQVDLVPRHLTITDERKALFDFTNPILVDREVLIAKAGVTSPASEQEILVSLPTRSAHISSVKKQYPNWQIEEFDAAYNSDDVAEKIVAGEFQYSVLDERSAKSLLSYRDDVEVVLTLPDNQFYGWALTKGKYRFKQQLDNFVTKHQIDLSKGAVRKLDLDILKQKKLPLRVITRNSPETYFLWKGELMGFEYELMEEFGNKNNLIVEYIVADSYQEMIDLLDSGKGDVIAAGLSRTEQRSKEHTFSIRYNRVSELLIANKSAAPINDFSDLSNRTISVRKSSAFWKTAEDLAKQYGAILQAAEESLSTELLIEQVANNQIDLTIADSNLFAIEQSFREEIISPLTLNDNVPYAYIVRNEDQKLLAALNGYIKSIYRKTFYNVVKNKYFSNQSRKEKHRASRLMPGSALSPFDEPVKQNADKFDFDWRLITAQMYQESRFNPKAKSHAGALGLMQVLPKTARELGYLDLTNPQESIAAGVEYLNWTRDRFPESLPLQERVFFALAAYNAGFGHVRDAQKLAKKLGLNDQKWFNNVEKAMLLLQRPEYYKKARFGYCRGSEPVNYVREINQRYLSYIDIVK